MRNIKVRKLELIDIMRKNLSEHKEAFLKAQAAYREAVIKALDEELKATREGAPFVLARFTRLVQPTCHTDDYERVIGMLEMHVESVVELTEPEYRCYVDDNWGWMAQFANEVTGYGVSNDKLARHLASHSCQTYVQ